MPCLSGFELYSRWVPLNKLKSTGTVNFKTKHNIAVSCSATQVVQLYYGCIVFSVISLCSLASLNNQPAIMPSPFISVICFREEGMIHFFHRSHAKKPESFSFLIGQETIRMICAIPIGQNAVIGQLLLISVCIFACVMSSEYTREFVMKFLPAQFSYQFEKMSKQKFHPLKYFPFHRILKIAVKNSPII